MLTVNETSFESAGLNVRKNEYGASAAAHAQPGTLDAKIRRQSRGPQVHSDDATSLHERLYHRTPRHYNKN